MKTPRSLRILLVFLTVSLLLSACKPPAESCTFTANTPITAYRLPDATSDVFGVMSSGETYKALARTAEGWF